MNKPIMQHYWDGAEWQERRREQRRLHLVPAGVKAKPSLRQRVGSWMRRADGWFTRNHRAVFDGCGVTIAYIVGIWFIVAVASQVGIRLGWW